MLKSRLRGIIQITKTGSAMFKKLVSNLAFSPALVGQLGFYAHRLKKEEATRRVGLIFTALALVVQSFAVFSPPEAANASSPNDFIYGGAYTIDAYLSNYDANTNNIRDLFNAVGISRSNIAAATKTQINSKDGFYSWGLNPHFSASQGEKSYTVAATGGGTRTFYMRPLRNWDGGSTLTTGSYYYAFRGVSTQGMEFWLMLNCGNLALKQMPPAHTCAESGKVGDYPNCTTPQCPAGQVGTYPNCQVSPVAKCESLKITKLLDNYQLQASASVAGSAKVTGYTYVVKKDGKEVKTIKQVSSALTDSATYSQSQQGTYEVSLTVETTLGPQTSPSCVKTFSIAPPAVCPVNPKLPATSPECQPCPGDSTLWIKDDKCAAKILETKSAKNITQGDVDATKTTAKAGDKVIYTLIIQNVGKTTTDVSITEQLADVLEYATVVDNGGGTFDETAKTLSWPKVAVDGGKSITRMFTVQLLETIPAMGQGVSDKTSYDCTMTNTFGNSVAIGVDCPVQKLVVEQTVNELPHTGPRENMIFAGVVLSTVAYFYARARQVKKEVRLIRRDLNAGTI